MQNYYSTEIQLHIQLLVQINKKKFQTKFDVHAARPKNVTIYNDSMIWYALGYDVNTV